MSYRALVEEMLFAMKYAGGLLDGIEHGIYTDLADGAAEALLDEAAKFAQNLLAPINRNGDLNGAKFVDGVVKTSPGWSEAYAPGTRAISLFLVPKFMIEANGSIGTRNDVKSVSIEHKLGIHGLPFPVNRARAVHFTGPATNGST